MPAAVWYIMALHRDAEQSRADLQGSCKEASCQVRIDYKMARPALRHPAHLSAPEPTGSAPPPTLPHLDCPQQQGLPSWQGLVWVCPHAEEQAGQF